MTSIDGISSQISGLRTQTSLQPENVTGSQELGQQDFLTLMTTQMKNQDPFAPMENGEFLAQMAQFSTVNGLDTINQTLESMSAQLGSSRVLNASSMIGRRVLGPGTLARADSAGVINGVVDLAGSVSSVSIRYTDADSGVLLHQQEMGPQPSGRLDFSWSDVPANIRDANGAIRVSVDVGGNGQSAAIAPMVYARVIGVEVPPEGTDFTLNIEDYGLRNSLEISALR